MTRARRRHVIFWLFEFILLTVCVYQAYSVYQELLFISLWSVEFELRVLILFKVYEVCNGLRFLTLCWVEIRVNKCWDL